MRRVKAFTDSVPNLQADELARIRTCDHSIIHFGDDYRPFIELLKMQSWTDFCKRSLINLIFDL